MTKEIKRRRAQKFGPEWMANLIKSKDQWTRKMVTSTRLGKVVKAKGSSLATGMVWILKMKMKDKFYEGRRWPGQRVEGRDIKEEIAQFTRQEESVLADRFVTDFVQELRARLKRRAKLRMHRESHPLARYL